jgi:hypothetical protein
VFADGVFAFHAFSSEALFSYTLIAFSMIAAVCAKQRSRGLRHMRKWTTIALCMVTIDYAIKCCIHPSGAVVVGLLTWGIVTTRSSAVFLFNFTNNDRNRPIQVAISIGSFVLCLVTALGSQWYLTGAIDRWTWLPLIGTGFGSLADSLNLEEYRLRSQFFMAVFHFAFGVVTNSWSLMIKTAVDGSACVAFSHTARQAYAAVARLRAKRDPQKAPAEALQTTSDLAAHERTDAFIGFGKGVSTMNPALHDRMTAVAFE